MSYLIGDIINIPSESNPGIGYYIEEYEWKWDNIIIPGTSILETILFDTTGQVEGEHILSLRVLNDCGEWSLDDIKIIELFEEEIPEKDNILTYVMLAGTVGLFIMKSKK